MPILNGQEMGIEKRPSRFVEIWKVFTEKGEKFLTLFVIRKKLLFMKGFP